MVKIAQIGAGYWGKNLVRNFAELGALGAIVDPNEQQAQALSSKHNVPARHLDDVLKDDDILGVSIATPAETHAEFALKAIAAGKHVFMEKPLALSVVDAQKVLDAAQSAGLIVMVGHLLQYHPIFIKMRDMIAQGACGNIQHIYSNRMSLGKFRLEENVWWSFAPHDISMVLAIAGEEPTHVTAQGGSYVTPNLADWTTAQLRFANGINAHFNISWLHPFKEQRLTVIGDQGMMVFEDSVADWDKKLALYKHRLNHAEGVAPTPEKADVEYIAVDKGEPLKDECAHFIDCIQNGTQPRTDGAEGIRVLRVLEQGEAALAAHLKA